ncbi:ABC transporter ATP-binding protein [Bauldia sp.]|uniref:ABC transporter ATP-binding protein n=1 Tax=Bauldia sp. TaxID=2575872 RepID=UPI003BACC052
MAVEPNNNALEVSGLSVEFRLLGQSIKAVNNVSFSLKRGETLCVVGESGSGKSVTGRALLQITRPGIITGGRIIFRDGDQPVDIAEMAPDSDAIRTIRGNRIAMIFQEPMSSLSPVHTIGDQIVEAIRLHNETTKEAAEERAIDLLRQVQIPQPEEAVKKYAFQFSGGMRQRAMIAMALSCRPDILIADEPTTALDVTTQAEILRLVIALQREMNMAVLFITHDLGVVAEVADRVAVMFRGEMIETGPAAQIFHAPQQAYTRQLIGASSKFSVTGGHDRDASDEETAKPILRVRDVNLTFRSSSGFIRRRSVKVDALKDVSFDLKEGENLGIVGESGSGKTTLARAIVGLVKAQTGSAIYNAGDSREIELFARDALRRNKLNAEIRMIFQDPFSSLNPRMTVYRIIAEPMAVNGVQNAEIADRVAWLLERVGLPPEMMRRYPHAFSGGQRQRICIARALAVNPRLIIADEATSALDGTIRTQILDLLFRLQDEFNLSFLFIGHDLGVVRYFCDRIAVMHRGEIVETGTAAQICEQPEKAYTRQLLAAVPSSDPSHRRLFAAA